jgi:hypothetical protein
MFQSKRNICRTSWHTRLCLGLRLHNIAIVSFRVQETRANSYNVFVQMTPSDGK